ncbi:hypothetical protein K2173_003998 [Erythroxylum novogranatense]|uniref:Ribonucleotide reductase large subunit C-terminal domain-containing protein n=1 Tax=Erythroxylum novogranatense TaxID=1862640 RepID=A0AAV8SJC5_9ROSI|nr:hypothetical protein K2173_003998 [Erythroxylum novogranatense]
MLFKDTCNRKSNWQNLGIPMDAHPSKLVGSRDCCKNRSFDFVKLAKVTEVVTHNLNKIIDVNYYPVETARRSNL